MAFISALNEVSQAMAVASLKSLEIQADIQEQLRNAVENGQIQLAKYLLQNGVKLECVDGDYLSIVRMNDLTGCKQVLQLAIKCGFDISARNYLGQNILHQLIAYNLSADHHAIAEIAEILISAGVPVDDVDKVGTSTVLYSIFSQNVELVALLIRKGADIHRKLKDGFYFAILEAVNCNNEELTSLLLSHGADVNAKNDFGTSPLHVACHNHEPRIIKLLLRAGADVCAEDKTGATPFIRLLHSTIFLDVECIPVVIREFARLVFENRPCSKKDLDLVQSIPDVRNNFERCKSELEEMTSTVFYGPYSYYCVRNMSKNIKKLAGLTKNKDFVDGFKTGVNRFNNYKNDLWEIFEEALRLRDSLVIVETRLNSVFGNFLPSVVIKVLTEKLSLKDLPL